MNAAYLYAQLEECDKINRKRHQVYDGYHERLEDLEKQGKIQRPVVPEGCVHNAHMYYIKVKDIAVRTRLIAYLRENGIAPAFHYVPLHSSPAGEKFGRFHGKDVYTTKESERLLRLPMFYDLSMDDVDYIAERSESLSLMEEGKLKRKKISAETTVEILFFLFLLVFYSVCGTCTALMGAGPDSRCAIRLRIIFISMVHFR